MAKYKSGLAALTTQAGYSGAILGGKITATTTAAKIPATALTGRKSITIRNESGQTAYVGSSTVTTAGANGMILKNTESLSIDLADDVALYVVLAASTGTVYVLEAS